MHQPLDLDQILFLDIETVSATQHFAELTEEMKALWDMKARQLLRDRIDLTPEEFYPERASIFAEFGKVVCVGVGTFQQAQDTQSGYRFSVKAYTDADEHTLLEQVAKLLGDIKTRPDVRGRRKILALCAHNGKEFDFPYLCRRMMIQRVVIPELLNLQGLKPWEVPHLDTMELWKFGDYKAFTSLKLLAAIFGIPSPKDDIDGADIYRVYYAEKDLARIAHYCCKDVLTVARVLQRMRYEEPVTDADVLML